MNFTHLSCLKQSQSGHMANAAGKNSTVVQCHLLGKKDWKNILMCPFSPAASNVLVSPPKLWQVLPLSLEGRPWIHGKKSRLFTALPMKHDLQQSHSWVRPYLHGQAPHKPKGLSSIWVAGNHKLAIRASFQHPNRKWEWRKQKLNNFLHANKLHEPFQ